RKPGRKSLTGNCGTDQRENSCTDDGADADTREIERAERALHLPLGRGRFSQQMVRTFSLEKLKGHCAESCHQLLCLVNANFAMSAKPRCRQSRVTFCRFGGICP